MKTVIEAYNVYDKGIVTQPSSKVANIASLMDVFGLHTDSAATFRQARPHLRCLAAKCCFEDQS